MSLSFECIVSSVGPGNYDSCALHDIAATRALEGSSSALSGNPSLMQKAGLAVARLALATAAHAQTFWIPCGPGNNGGDGLIAAAHLKRWGKNVIVTQAAHARRMSEASEALRMATEAGVLLTNEVPGHFDACIDALFGIGHLRALDAPYAQWIDHMNGAGKPLLAVDVPSGLNAETGLAQDCAVHATHTLSLLTLKPGLFTGQGRDYCGDIWLHRLGVSAEETASASLIAAPPGQRRLHSSHKGSYGDVYVVGGATGMRGAALLAANAALQGGAGRVYVCLLQTQAPGFSELHPELMFRDLHTLDLPNAVAVAGCGGGEAIVDELPLLLKEAGKLVLDADALNQIAKSESLHRALLARPPDSTVLTPHPLEAARLLGQQTQGIQANRLQASLELCQKFQCVNVLKGSGTVVSAPGRLPHINVTGNAKLASAGTGDVLAGLIGAEMAVGASAWSAACRGVYRHGLAANRCNTPGFTASALVRCL